MKSDADGERERVYSFVTLTRATQERHLVGHQAEEGGDIGQGHLLNFHGKKRVKQSQWV